MNNLAVVNTTANALINTELKADLISKFIQFADIREKSKDTYLKSVKQFFVFLSERGIKSPVREDVISWREYLKENHKATTIQTYLTALKVFFLWCEQENIYPNIAAHVKAVKVTSLHKRDPLTANQAHDLLESIDTSNEKGARDYALLSLMLTTGLRTIEVERANLEDLRVVGDTTALFLQGKGRDERAEYVKVSPKVDKAIRTYLSFRGDIDPKGPLFATTGNRNKAGRMGTRSIRGIVKAHLRDAGLNSDRLTAHSLRHTAGTIALLNGASIREVQQLLRHSNINTTMIYSHELDRAQNNSELKISDAIF